MIHILYKITGNESVEFIYGVYAYASGLKRGANPYPPETEEERDWDLGWLEEWLNDDD
jgi:hypothetical protein